MDTWWNFGHELSLMSYSVPSKQGAYSRSRWYCTLEILPLLTIASVHAICALNQMHVGAPDVGCCFAMLVWSLTHTHKTRTRSFKLVAIRHCETDSWPLRACRLRTSCRDDGPGGCRGLQPAVEEGVPGTVHARCAHGASIWVVLGTTFSNLEGTACRCWGKGPQIVCPHPFVCFPT